MSSITSSIEENSKVYYSGKSAGPTNYIGDGLKFSFNQTNPLSVDINPGYMNISRKYQEITQTVNQSLPPKTASLICATKTEYSDCPIINAVPASFPVVDANTVCRWIIDGSSTIENSAIGVNGNTIAVSNVLTKTGTVTPVDGICGGNAGQGDGSTGYYVSANSTGFPVGTAVRTLRALWTCRSVTIVYETIIGYGATGVSQGFDIVSMNGTLTFYDNTNSYSTSYSFAIGQTYLIEVGYDGSNLICLVNGKQIYKVAYSMATVASVAYILRNSGASNGFSNGVLHYIELRTTVPTEQTSGPIANKLLFPCRYTGYSGAYPTAQTADASTYHEWRLAESSGTTIADTQTTSALPGTAIGTTIVNSDIISGAKARSFNGTSDYVTLGSYTNPSNFTVIGVINARGWGNTYWMSLVSNRTTLTNGLYIGLQTNGILGLYSNAMAVSSNSGIALNVPQFFAVVVNSGFCSMYVNSPNVDATSAITMSSIAGTLAIGKDTGGGTGTFFNGVFEELLIIPRALSQAEMAQYYNALMKQGDRTIIDDVVPANSLALGMAQTSSTAAVSYDDSSYKYGRREGLTGGNRKVFLGWQYFSGAATKSWTNNPFGTMKIETELHWASDAMGTNETVVSPYQTSPSSVGYGVIQGTMTNGNIMAYPQAGGAVVFNGAWQTSGYIGCYAEVIE